MNCLHFPKVWATEVRQPARRERCLFGHFDLSISVLFLGEIDSGALRILVAESQLHFKLRILR